MHGCRKVIWSFSAVVKTADSTVIAYRIVGGFTPLACRAATQLRTSAGEMSIIR
jgi:hypothetical protein